jgi:hypothetical protein
MSKALENIKPASPVSQEVDASIIEKAVASAVGTVLEGLFSKLNLNQFGSGPKDDEFSARSLASELKKMSGHDEGRIHVEPEIMERQAKAKKEMHNLLRDLRSKRGTPHEEKPLYKVIGDIYLAGRLYDSSRKQPLCWWGEPNQNVLPVNSVARKIYDLFKVSISLPVDPVPASEINDSENGIVRYKGASNIYEENLLEDNSTPNMSVVDLKDLVVPSDLLDDEPVTSFYPNGFRSDNSQQYATR